MNPLILTQVQQLLGQVNVFHLLQVLTGADQPDEKERRDLRFLLEMVDNPATGDFIWKPLSEYLEKSGYSTLFLGYLNQGLQNLGVDTPAPTDVLSAKAPLAALVRAVLNQPDIPRLRAVSQCPQCKYIYGETQ